MFYFFGAGVNLFLFFLLISKKNKSLADKILAAWLFVILCHLALYLFSFQPVTINNIHQIGLSIPFPFLHGPFLYLYTAALTNQLPGKKWRWMHFLPALLIILIFLPLLFSSAAFKMEVFNSKGKDYVLLLNIAGWLMKLSGIVYVSWSFALLRKHKKNIGELFSYDEMINLNWLRYLIYAMLAVWVIIIFIQKDAFIFGAVVVCVFFIGFFGIKQVGIFGQKEEWLTRSRKATDPALLQDHTVLKEKEEPAIPALLAETDPVMETGSSKLKYSNSGLSEKLAAEIHEGLIRLMTREKTFTEPALSLTMLAAKLNAHPNYLSQVINEKEGKSFFDYINTLRVDEFKRLVVLPGSSQFTMMSLAYDCGFNSKSSFNKNFKKITGISPSVYLAGITDAPPPAHTPQ